MMIKSLELQNFKAFENLKIDISNLTLLSGLNGSGKSTVIQSLVLLRQSLGNESLSGLMLNGDFLNLGIGRDVLYSGSEEDYIHIILKNEEDTLSAKFEYDSEADFLPLFDAENIKVLDNAFLRAIMYNFEYVSANRVPPQFTHLTSHKKVFTENTVGIQGEYAVSYLNLRADDSVENIGFKNINDGQLNLLHSQVDYWMNYVMPGAKLYSEKYQNANLVGLRVRIAGSETVNEFSSVNVGFGVTYVLPVLIALLKCKEDDVLIIENPEAHLHPKGQRRMGEMIARAAMGGAQIIIETHSDHILNGIRIAVKNSVIKPDKVNFYFFDRLSHDINVSNPTIDKHGKMSEWPEGFFDEWDNALLEMF